MFSVRQKREIADAVQKILRATEHPELRQARFDSVSTLAGRNPGRGPTFRTTGPCRIRA